MKINKIAQIGLGIGLLWLGVLRGAKGLVVRMSDYAFAGFNEDGTMRLVLNLSVRNPLIIGIKIKGVQGDVFAQGYKVGTINTTYDYYLAGGKTHMLPVYVNLDISEAWAAVWNAGLKTLLVAFDGKVYAGKYNIGIPLQFEMEYKGV